MSDKSESGLEKLQEKLLNFQKKGLEMYREYLNQQLIDSQQSDNRNAYKVYIKTQLMDNDSKIKAIEDKLAYLK